MAVTIGFQPGGTRLRMAPLKQAIESGLIFAKIGHSLRRFLLGLP